MGFDIVQFLIERPLLVLMLAMATIKVLELHAYYLKRRRTTDQDDANLMQAYVDAVRSGKVK